MQGEEREDFRASKRMKMRTYQKVASLARDFTTSQGKEPKAHRKYSKEGR